LTGTEWHHNVSTVSHPLCNNNETAAFQNLIQTY
jgi:hypothetical protein